MPATSLFNLGAVRPLPKAPPRSGSSYRGSKRKKTASLTDTPEKEAKKKNAAAKRKRGRNKMAKKRNVKHDRAERNELQERQLYAK